MSEQPKDELDTAMTVRVIRCVSTEGHIWQDGYCVNCGNEWRKDVAWLPALPGSYPPVPDSPEQVVEVRIAGLVWRRSAGASWHHTGTGKREYYASGFECVMLDRIAEMESATSLDRAHIEHSRCVLKEQQSYQRYLHCENTNEPEERAGLKGAWLHRVNKLQESLEVLAGEMAR